MLPLFGAGLLLIVIGVSYRAIVSSGMSVSAVRRELHAAAQEGAYLGQLKIFASGTDIATGDLLEFRAQTDSFFIAAERAAIEIDAEENTVSFRLTKVVFTRAPDEDDGNEGTLVGLESHLLGPFPYGRDIVPDGDAPTTGRVPDLVLVEPE